MVDAETGGKIEQRNGWNDQHTAEDSSSGNSKARQITHSSSASELSPGGVKTTHMLQNSNENKIELAQQLLDHLLGQYFKKSGTFRALTSAAIRADVPTDVVSVCMREGGWCVLICMHYNALEFQVSRNIRSLRLLLWHTRM